LQKKEFTVRTGSFILSRVLIRVIIILLISVGKLEAALSAEVADCLQQRISNGEASGKSLLHFAYNDEVAARLMKTFYQDRNGLPAWSDDDGPGELAENLLGVLKRAYREGLYPSDYQVERIESVMEDLKQVKDKGGYLDPDQVADFDLLLTEAFFSYATHLSGGRADQQRQYPGWVYKSKQINFMEALINALKNRDLERALSELAPRFYEYTKLRERLNYYIDIAECGGWTLIPAGQTMKKGICDDRIGLLRNRLMITSEALDSGKAAEPDYFDNDLEAAVREFQLQHSLSVNGVVDTSTLRELNVSVEERICQIAVNLDRLRWLPNELGDRYILVNIPDFNLEVVDNQRIVMNIRAIVGQMDKRTNLLSSRITYLELNPYWRVPDSIAMKEILPKLRKNPGYLAANRIRVFRDWEDNMKEVDPRKINWSRIKADELGYKFRQEPGPLNPLGRIKFIFPNECEIYLHDTPKRYLFGKNRRDFSHGCIRIEKPIELAAYLLKDKESWTRTKIMAEIGKEKRQVVTLPDPIDVYILYGTAWVDREGNLQFRDDIYRADEVPYEPATCENHRGGT